jgi:hypothetical protein
VLGLWRPEPPGERWTTVLTWKNFQQEIEHDGRSYGTKEREFGKIEMLPSLVGASLEMALGGASAPTERWREIGWSIVDSVERSRTPADYRAYVQSSRGELSVAKNVYVDTNSGWFSCRSVCYLASSRPVVVQDTGFSRILPSECGLIAFADLVGAASGIERVERDYEAHQQAALELARTRFAAPVVLADLLGRIGL